MKDGVFSLAKTAHSLPEHCLGRGSRNLHPADYPELAGEFIGKEGERRFGQVFRKGKEIGKGIRNYVEKRGGAEAFIPGETAEEKKSFLAWPQYDLESNRTPLY